MVFTKAELSYLAAQPLGRLATIGPGGAPQVTPVAYWVDTAEHRIAVSGPGFGASQKVRNIQADARISFVVDDIAAEPVGPGGQRGRGLEIRGHGELLILDHPLLEGFSNESLRIHPRRVIAWNLDEPGRNARTVAKP